jgi:hypothetical protein
MNEMIDWMVDWMDGDAMRCDAMQQLDTVAR